MISVHPIRGKRCWAYFCGSYGLPEGLTDRTPLVVLEWQGFEGKFRDEQGRIWDIVSFECLDVFQHYKLPYDTE